jgi:hypothetical protein
MERGRRLPQFARGNLPYTLFGGVRHKLGKKRDNERFLWH